MEHSGVDAQAQALARAPGRGAELGKLARGVEDDVVRVLQKARKLVLPVGCAEDVDFLARHLLRAQARLEQAAGFRARKVRREDRIEVEVGERLLRQEHAAARPRGEVPQDLAVAAQGGLVQHVAGRGQAGKNRLRPAAGKARKGRARVGPHQSTSAGAWDSCLGRP